MSAVASDSGGAGTTGGAAGGAAGRTAGPLAQAARTTRARQRMPPCLTGVQRRSRSLRLRGSLARTVGERYHRAVKFVVAAVALVGLAGVAHADDELPLVGTFELAVGGA